VVTAEDTAPNRTKDPNNVTEKTVTEQPDQHAACAAVRRRTNFKLTRYRGGNHLAKPYNSSYTCFYPVGYLGYDLEIRDNLISVTSPPELEGPKPPSWAHNLIGFIRRWTRWGPVSLLLPLACVVFLQEVGNNNRGISPFVSGS
jgi:hypothetical protein